MGLLLESYRDEYVSDWICCPFHALQIAKLFHTNISTLVAFGVGDDLSYSVTVNTWGEEHRSLRTCATSRMWTGVVWVCVSETKHKVHVYHKLFSLLVLGHQSWESKVTELEEVVFLTQVIQEDERNHLCEHQTRDMSTRSYHRSALSFGGALSKLDLLVRESQNCLKWIIWSIGFFFAKKDNNPKKKSHCAGTSNMYHTNQGHFFF